LIADRFLTSNLKTIESETKISRSKNKHKLLMTNSEDVRFKNAMAVNNELNNDKTEKHFSKNIIPNNNIYEDIVIEDDLAYYTISKDNEIVKTICVGPYEGNNILGNYSYETDNIKDLLKERQTKRWWNKE